MSFHQGLRVKFNGRNGFASQMFPLKGTLFTNRLTGETIQQKGGPGTLGGDWIRGASVFTNKNTGEQIIQAARGILGQDWIEKIIKWAGNAFNGKEKACVWPAERDPVTGNCVAPFLGDQPGPDDRGVGEAVMGRYGAALEPGRKAISRAVCLRGMVLGDDGLCYNRSQIKNSEREWPRGRRPLLTGGEMRAISIAARAGARLEGATKRLQKIGLMKKQARRVSRPAHSPPHNEH